MTDRSREADGFGAYFRRYTRTWVHAVATAALTGLGILTFVHRGFAVLAVAAYVLPPVVLYLRDSSVVAPSTTDDRADASPAGSDDRSAANGAGPGRSSEAGTDESAHFWSVASIPSDEQLFDVATTGDRTYAVGGDGGVFARGLGAREGSEDRSLGDVDGGWTAVLDDGPGAAANALRGVDAVPDGGVWIAGDGGALGRIDPATDRRVDYSAPDGDTSAITDVAAAGGDDGEVVLLADGSGRIRRGRRHVDELTWDQPVTPGSGSSLTSLTLVDESVGYACDSNQSVFATSDGGRSFERIGLDDADGTLTGVAGGADGCAASADDGVVHRYDGTNWTPDSLGDGAIHALTVRADHWLACGDAGVAFERGEGSTDWRRLATPATGPLYGCALSESIAVAVGEDGTVVERER